jgi:hypothetical protein
MRGEEERVMAKDALADRNEQQCAFLDGWFTQQFAAGERPDYGYPKNHVPDTYLDGMEVVTGFMAKPKQ